ncbi:MAG: PAS domain S-box protein, partial [Flavobacteriaceae bacterium]|nr:PAS domain S-box protein [Flavobacteriaceae bacterium]
NELKHIKGNSFRAGIGLTKEGVTFPIEISFNMWDDDDNRTHCAFIKNITQEEHERKVKEIIYNITKYAQERPTFEVLFPFIKDILNSVIDTTNLFVSLYDENNTEKTKSYQEYLRGNPSDTYIPSHPSTRTDLEHYVFNTRKSFLYKPSSKIDNSGTKSKCWIGVPLIVKQQITGVMSVVNNTNEKAYSQKDIDLLELVASTISQVLQQSKDFEKINLLNQALIQSPSIIVITSIKGKIEYVNPHFTKITGYEPNEVLGKDPSIFGSSQKDKLIIANLWKTITRGESWKGEFTNIKKDGSSFTVLSTIAPVKNDINEITHYISVQEDITDKLKLEAQFINGFIEAQEIEKQNFGQELHDGISQILSAETMYIDVLIKQNQDRINDKAKFLTKIKELNLSAANEARNIAHGLMSNQLMEAGLIKAIENICTDYSNTKNIKFTYIHKNINENELPKEIKINLFRIVQEVTTNIIRHSKATKVTITFTKLQKDTLSLIIEDNGIGIDFSKTEGKPKGIGFENIKRRITLLKGTLDIDTSPNNGLCFIINIPCYKIG